MSKYYVQSRELKRVIAGPHIKTPEDAAIEAVLSSKSRKLSHTIIVSVRGFEFHFHDDDEDLAFNTKDILKKAGLV